MKLTTEYSIRLYDDDSGDYMELRPNIEGCGLYEVRAVAQGQTEGRLVLTDEQVDALIDGLKRLKELNAPKVKVEFVLPGASPIPPGMIPPQIVPLAHGNR